MAGFIWANTQTTTQTIAKGAVHGHLRGGFDEEQVFAAVCLDL
ncbi:hypothetical protein AAAT03_03360 [Collinsella sp. CLA-AA-H167]|nr:hypothetical protein [Collinsella aerofaciens]